MKGSFNKEEFVEWQHTAVRAMAELAAMEREDGTKDDYLAAVAFGAGAVAGMNVVRESLESGRAMDELGMLVIFSSIFECNKKAGAYIESMYDMQKKED